MPHIHALTHGPKHHFFGYYGVNAWNHAQTHHLALETDFQDRKPTPEDEARVGLVSSATGEFQTVASTRAFNFQQGSMMGWIRNGEHEELTFNDWEGDRVVSRAVNSVTGTRRTIDGGIEAISPDGTWGIGLNFARMYRCRTVVGYANHHYPQEFPVHPEDDGLFHLDMATGESRLLVSIAQVIEANPMPQAFEGTAWLDHVCINPGGNRIFFFCRIRKPDWSWYSSFWTVNTDGTDLRCQVDYRYWISHFAWKDDRSILITSDAISPAGYMEFTDNQSDFRPVAPDVLPRDGHACYSPDGRFLVSDTFRNTSEGRYGDLFLFDIKKNRKIDLGSFFQPPELKGDLRCDLHPRWSPDGKSVTFDSVHEGDRQIYLADVSDIV